jgi:hypothetical protein
MRPHFEFWLFLGGMLVAGALGAAAIAGGLLASRDDYAFATSVPMWIAYALTALGFVCFVAAVRDWRFPFVASSHLQAATEREAREKARADAISAIGQCVRDAEYARFVMFDNSRNLSERTRAYSEWINASSEVLEKHSPGDVAGFRRSLSVLAVDYVGFHAEEPIRGELMNLISQLDKRRDMLVAIIDRMQQA